MLLAKRTVAQASPLTASSSLSSVSSSALSNCLPSTSLPQLRSFTHATTLTQSTLHSHIFSHPAFSHCQYQHANIHGSSTSSSRSRLSSAASRRLLILAGLISAALASYDSHSEAHAQSLVEEHTPLLSQPVNPVSSSVSASNALIGVDVEIASLWRRLFAFLVDNIITSIAFNATFLIVHGSTYEVLIVPISFIFNALYEILMTSYNHGQTVGKMLFQIQTINEAMEHNMEPVPLLNSAYAFIGKILNVFLLCDVAYCLLDRTGENRAVHNLMSSTIVVKTTTQSSKHQRKQDIVKDSASK